MARATLLAVCLALAICTVARGAVDHTPIRMTAQDATGVVWAAAMPYNGGNGTVRWQDGHWAQVRAPTPEGGWGVGVWPGLGGSVLILWSPRSGSRNVLYSYKGSQSNLIAHLNVQLNGLRVLTTPPDNIWIVGDSPILYRVEGGHVRAVYTFRPEQFMSYTSWPPGRPTIYCRWEATQDSDGRTWFWSNAVSMYSNVAPLEGVVIYDGHTFAYHRTIAGLPTDGITFLGPGRRRGHLIAAVLGAGLYSVDTRALDAKPLGSPEPRALWRVTKVFVVRNDVYAVTAPRNGIRHVPYETPGHEFSDGLWRFHSGKWSEVLPGVDDVPLIGGGLLRPWLQTKRGVFVGAEASGMWFLPFHGAPRLIDWKQGLPLDTVNGLYRIGQPDGGRLLTVDSAPANRTASAEIAHLLAKSENTASTEIINPVTSLEPGSRGHLWGIVTYSGRSLDEWNGKTWIHHPLPGNLTPLWLSGADMDSQGRVWLFPGCQLGPIAIFNPNRETWTDYPSYQAALRAQVGHVKFVNANDDQMSPIYGPDGQMEFTGACRGINYFNGTRWRLWNRPGVPGDRHFFFDAPAFFDSAGRLAVNIHHETWEFSPGQSWHPIPYQASRRAWVRLLASSAPAEPPAGCPVTRSTSLATDRLGRSWWTWDGNLYEGIAGRCRRVFEPNEEQPFIDGRRLRQVLLDSHGNTFLETSIANHRVGEYVLYSTPGPGPGVSIRIKSLSPDSVRLNFTSPAPGKVLYSWRLDHGAWSTPDTQQTEALTALPSGRHTIDVTAFDSDLDADAVPASATIDINMNPEQQMAGLIEQLEAAANDDQRQAAVNAIERQPSAVAIPALRSALKIANSTARWWITAALESFAQGSSQSLTNR